MLQAKVHTFSIDMTTAYMQSQWHTRQQYACRIIAQSADATLSHVSHSCDTHQESDPEPRQVFKCSRGTLVVVYGNTRETTYAQRICFINSNLRPHIYPKGIHKWSRVWGRVWGSDRNAHRVNS